MRRAGLTRHGAARCYGGNHRNERGRLAGPHLPFNARDFPSWYTTHSYPLNGLHLHIHCAHQGQALERRVGVDRLPAPPSIRWQRAIARGWPPLGAPLRLSEFRSERAPAVAGDSRGIIRHAAPRFRCMAERRTRRASSSARVAPRGHPRARKSNPSASKHAARWRPSRIHVAGMLRCCPRYPAASSRSHCLSAPNGRSVVIGQS